MLTPEQIADGWIEHDGGPCPVGARVPVIYRDGAIEQAGPSSILWSWFSGSSGENDIIAYKPADA